ncbi:MAG: flagellar biosynthesis anti-sigma factor FlgM [Planctomycetota bacterium]
MRIEGSPIQSRSADTSAHSIAQAQAPAAGLSDRRTTSGVGTEDTVELSEEARQIMGVQTGKSSELPVRPEMVERAKALLASRQYNDRAVLEKTAERIAQSVDLTA